MCPSFTFSPRHASGGGSTPPLPSRTTVRRYLSLERPIVSSAARVHMERVRRRQKAFRLGLGPGLSRTFHVRNLSAPGWLEPFLWPSLTTAGWRGLGVGKEDASGLPAHLAPNDFWALASKTLLSPWTRDQERHIPSPAPPHFPPFLRLPTPCLPPQLCPVTCCPSRHGKEAQDRTTKHGINHVELHTVGQLDGQVQNATSARCGHGSCPKTRPCRSRCHPTSNNPVSQCKERPQTSRHFRELSFLWMLQRDRGGFAPKHIKGGPIPGDRGRYQGPRAASQAPSSPGSPVPRSRR